MYSRSIDGMLHGMFAVMAVLLLVTILKEKIAQVLVAARDFWN